MTTIHATDFISAKKKPDAVPVIAMFGAERYLKLEAIKRIPGLDGEDAELSLTKLAGSQTDLRTVLTELKTVSMFGEQRVVLIEDADDFVSENRAALEKYVDQPARASLLILDLKAFQKSTRLYKAIDASGLIVECTELKGASLAKWLIKHATDEYQKTLDKEAAQLIVQLTGDSIGMLQQEVAKVASLVGDTEQITVEDVSRVVGGWRLETTWEMLDAVRDGKLSKALVSLDKLLIAGDAPQKIMGGVVYSFRKYAEATEIARQTRDVRSALSAAGVFPAAIGPAEAYLRRIGFEKASRIYQWLVEADHNMKGGSRIDPRLTLERLFIQLAG
ncbi:MAG: DNA polymerase III subunit delta [Planctomycetaceae bacterium]|nr:DNA polymerase III subunit delta [Planctomycetaceae bacterium]MCA9064124.1 DNA polymerase III subunit delta [Planctomycetaceae bacterium]